MTEVLIPGILVGLFCFFLHIARCGLKDSLLAKTSLLIPAFPEWALGSASFTRSGLSFQDRVAEVHFFCHSSSILPVQQGNRCIDSPHPHYLLQIAHHSSEICSLIIEADTQIANIYSNGVSEEIIGKALKEYNIPRHKVVILSKCFAYIGEEPWMQNAPEVSTFMFQSINRPAYS
jgi:hypothetical protein